MKILYLALFPVLLSAQQKQPVSSLQEDCGVTFNFAVASSGAQAAVNSPGTTPVIDNRQVGCLDWLVTYETTSVVTVISLAFQSATDVAGVPTTWSNYPGTLTTGINPNTAVTTGGAVTQATGTAYPFLRMNLTVLTGAGRVSGKLYGWKRRPTYVTISSGGGCVGTSATPCVVDGPTAAGSPPTTPPVLVAGQDGTNIQTIKTDTAGRPQVAGAAAFGAASAGNPVWVAGTTALGIIQPFQLDTNGGLIPSGFIGALLDNLSNSSLGIPSLQTAAGAAGVTPGSERVLPYIFNGSTWDRQFSCTNRANITLTTSGLTRIITGTSAKKIRLCSLSMSFAAPVDVQVVEGTKVTTDCDTGATNMTGLYRSVVGFDPNLSNLFTLTEATAADDVCISMGTSVNGGGTAIYAVF
jgi:hypothetical protein